MRVFLTSRLLRRILAALLIVSLVPLGIIAFFAIDSYQTTRTEVVEQSKTSLEEKAIDGLQGRTLALAEAVASFLEEREVDLYTLASLPRTQEDYLGFAQAKQSELWTISPDGEEVHAFMPLYREVVFIDADGNEEIKIVNECESYPFDCQVAFSGDLYDVSDPANTLLKSEDYFSEAANLAEGELYVGPALGEYVPYEEAYAGTQRRDGQRYRGVLRFATPVYENGEFAGVVVLATETLHLIEVASHTAPANPAPQAEIDPREADFAYLVDPSGWAISHPRHFNITGVDENGERVPPISEANRTAPDNLFRPGNLAEMEFIDPIFPQLLVEQKAGRNGYEIGITPLGREARAIFYAPIPYDGGRYDTAGGFGLVVLSTDGARFSLEADLLGKQINNRITDLITQLQLLAGATFVVGLALAVMLARSIAFPIFELTETSREIEEGRWEDADLDGLSAKTGEDEVSRLSRVFASMAQEVKTREEKLKKRVQELEIVIEESKVEEQVSEITESEFFVNLTQKAAKMRKERHQREKEEAEKEEKE